MTDRELKQSVINALDLPTREEKLLRLEEIKDQAITDGIRVRYPLNTELAIQRKHSAGIDNGEFAVYNNYCEQVKREQKEKIARLVEMYGR